MRRAYQDLITIESSLSLSIMVLLFVAGLVNR